MKQPTTDGVRCVLAWTQAIFFALLFSNIVWIPYVHAAPQGGNVVGGSGTINQSGNQTTINQNSQNMAIDWQSYNLNTNERVQYIQPNSASISLNRILSNSASEIRGRIDANGQVILINPHGVLFTPSSVINVGGIIASSLDMNPTDFMNGNYIFNEVLGTEGKVVNSGIINAAVGGNVALIGKQVRNDGLIVAKLGSVNLAAGKEAVLTFDNTGLIGVKVTKAILQEEIGVDPAVLNSGEIIAEGGRVLLTASVSQDVFSQAVNTGGMEPATSVVVHEDGTFTLGGGADVVNSGSIDVSKSADTDSSDSTTNDPNTARIILIGENVTSSGTIKADNANGDGGEIELHAKDTTLLTENSLTSARSEANGKGGIVKVLGDKVGMFDQSTVDVSGASGGGQALIGGDYQGKNNYIRNSTETIANRGTSIYADALDQSDGGKVILWSDGNTFFGGAIYTRGGSQSGNGGLVETSGKENLIFRGNTDRTAVNGYTGLLLLDPRDIIIGSATNQDNQLNDGIVNFGDGGNSSFNISAEKLVSELSQGSVTLQANRDIRIGRDIIADSGNTNSLSMYAGDDIRVGESDNFITVNLQGGDLTMMSGVTSVQEVACNTCENNGLNNVNINGAIQTTGAITINSADNVIVNQAIGGTNNPSSVSIHAGNDIYVSNGENLGGGVTSNGSITANGKVTLVAGDGTLQDASRTDFILDTPDTSVTGDIIISGNVTTNGSEFKATTDDGYFDNWFPNQSINVGSGAVVIEAGGTETYNINGTDVTAGAFLGDISAGSLSVTTTTGQIIQSTAASQKLSITGTASFDAGAHDITLQNTNNDIQGNIDLTSTAGNITLSNASTTTKINNVEVHGNLTINAANNLNMTGSINAINTTGVASNLNFNFGLAAGSTFTATSGASITRDVSSTDNINIAINGGADADVITFDGYNITDNSLTGTLSLAVNGGEGGDDFNLTSSTSFDGLSSIAFNGNGGNDNFDMNSAAFTDITDITFNGNAGQDAFNLINATFSNVTNLTANGNENNDQFDIRVSASASLNQLKLDGNDGDDTFNINAENLVLNIIDTGGNETNGDKVIGHNVGTNTWVINSTGTGTLNTDIAFSGIENLTGRENQDNFTFSGPAGRVNGLVDGGGGANDTVKIDYAGITVELGNRTGAQAIADLATLNINNVETITAFGNGNTLIGDTAENIWTVNNNNLSGTVANADITVNHFNFGNLTGGDGVDTFNITSDFSGTIRGGVAGIETAASNDVFNIQVAAGSVFAGKLIGGAGDDQFILAAASSGVTINQSIDGGAGNDSISAADEANYWSFLTNAGEGGVDGEIYRSDSDRSQDNPRTSPGFSPSPRLQFTSMEILNGGAQVDDYLVPNDGIPSGISINGRSGVDALNLSNVTGTIVLAVGPEGYSAPDVFTGFEYYIGNGTNSTLVAANDASDHDWSIQQVLYPDGVTLSNGENDGTLTFGSAGETITFIDFANLTGSAGGDDFVFQSGGSLTGLADGGLGINTLDTQAITAGVTVELGDRTVYAPGRIHVDNISTITAAAGANNTIIGDYDLALPVTNNWVIEGTNSGRVNGIEFNNFNRLVGNDGQDIFQLHDTIDFSGSISGGGGVNDQLLAGNRALNNWAITGNNNTGTVTGLTGTFSAVETLTGNSQQDIFQLHDTVDFAGSIDGGGGTNDELRGGNRILNEWSITNANNTGTVTGLSGTFSRIGMLRGGNQQDIFQLHDSIDFAGSIDGGGNAGIGDELRGGNRPNNWKITALNNTGTVTGLTGTFTDIQALTGGGLKDIFQLHDTISFNGSISGGGGTEDELQGGARNTYWQITGANNTGTVTGLTGGTFSNFETLTGNSFNDYFYLHNSVDFSGDINGGLGGNYLLAGNRTSNWIIDESNGGTVTGLTGRFSDIAYLYGANTADDTFTFQSGGSLSGFIHGRGHVTRDIVDISSLTNDLEVGIGTAGSDINIWDVERVIGGNDGAGPNHTFVGQNTNNIWQFGDYSGSESDARNDGRVSSNGGITYVEYVNFNNVKGGNLSDTFTFAQGSSLSGWIDGGAANRPAWQTGETWEAFDSLAVGDKVDMSALTNGVDVTVGPDGNIRNIELVIGANNRSNGTRSIIRSSGAGPNYWNIKGNDDEGIVNGTEFKQFNRVEGGTADDIFVETSGTITNGIDGGSGAGVDSIDYRELAAKTVQLGGDFGISDIERVIGDGDGFVIKGLAGEDNIWTITGANEGDVVAGNEQLAFEGFAELQGSDTNRDEFLIRGGSLDGTMYGNGGDDLLDVVLTGSETGLARFDGGSGNNEVVIRDDPNGTPPPFGAYNGVFTANQSGYDRTVYTTDDANSNQYTIEYKGIGTITDSLDANSLTISGTSGNDTVTLGSNVNGTYYDIDTSANSGVSVTYANKDNIAVQGNGGNDEVVLADAYTSGGNLSLQAETVSSAANLITANGLTLDGVLTLNGDPADNGRIQTNINTLNLTDSSDIAIRETDDIILGNVTTNNRVDVIAAGNISGSNLVSNAEWILNSTGSDISLTGNNRLSGPLNLSGNNVTLVNNVTTQLARVNAATFDVTVNNADLNGTGPNTIGNLIIRNANNANINEQDGLSINSARLSGKLTTSSSSLAIGEIHAAEVDLTARAGAITDLDGDAAVDIVAGRTRMRSTQGIGSQTDAIETQTAELDVINDAGNNNGSVINIKNNGNVLVSNLVNSGNIRFENTSDVTIDRIDAGYDAANGNGHLVLNVFDGSVYGINRSVPYFTVADITANTAAIYVEGNFGTRIRPINLHIRSELQLFAQTSAYTFLNNRKPPLFTDNSTETLAIINDLGLGQQLIEVESLAEIDPAIFTEVRNYYHEDLAIMMPDDQLYSDEEEEQRRKMSKR